MKLQKRDIITKALQASVLLLVLLFMLRSYITVIIDNDYSNVSALDFFDYGIFILGLMFMSLYAQGRANRYGLVFYIMLIPVIYLMFEGLINFVPTNTWLIGPIVAITYYLAFDGKPLTRLRTITYLSIGTLIAIGFQNYLPETNTNTWLTSPMFALTAWFGLWFFRLRIPIAMTLNNKFKTKIPTRITNLMLVCDRFMVVGVSFDLLYWLASYALAAIYGTGETGSVRAVVGVDSLLDPALYHSYALLTIQSWFTMFFVIHALRDVLKPDSVGVNKNMIWDTRRAEEVQSHQSKSLWNAAMEVGMQIGALCLVMAMITDTFRAGTGTYYILFGIGVIIVFGLLSVFKQTALHNGGKIGLAIMAIGGLDLNYPIMALGAGLWVFTLTYKIYLQHLDTPTIGVKKAT